jgi:hypothetical protein
MINKIPMKQTGPLTKRSVFVNDKRINRTKILITLFMVILPLMSYSQIFNTASTLKPGKVSFGLNPLVFEKDFGLFLHGGIGIKSGVDLALHYGFLEYDDYFGADLEWRLIQGKPSLSLITGAHKRYDTGLDLGINLSFPITAGTQLYTGLDMDYNFGRDNRSNYTQAWLPIGVEIALKRSTSFMFEAEIPINDNAYTIFGGGIVFYF